jgi:mono/diheme cytochrome c family protein
LPESVRRLGTIFAALLVAGCASGAYRGPANPSGAELYRLHCAGCHGPHGHGDGPVAPLLTIAVPDLTRIAARRGGTFPEEDVFRIIDGQSPRAAHGTRRMPVWGYEFFDPQGDDRTAHRQASERIDRLVRYLASIQRVDEARE